MRNLLSAMRRHGAPAPTTPAAPSTPASAATGEDAERWRRKLAEADARAAQLAKELDAEKRRAAAAAAERDAERVRTTLVRAAANANAHEPEDVADLLARRVVLRDGRIVATDDPEKDAAVVVAEFLAAKPAYVRAQVAPGSGAPPRAAAAPAPPAPAAHDTRTREGATAAMHDALRARLAPTSATPAGAPGRGGHH